MPSDSITGRLMQVSLEMCQLDVGIGSQLFTLDYDKFHSLTEESWIKQLWKFLHEHKISIINRVTELPLP